MGSEVVKVEMRRDHATGKYAHIDGNASGVIARLIPEMKVGEVKSVRITVEIVETPLEKLRRARDEWMKSPVPRERNSTDDGLIGAVLEYLASAEGEGV